MQGTTTYPNSLEKSFLKYYVYNKMPEYFLDIHCKPNNPSKQWAEDSLQSGHILMVLKSARYRLNTQYNTSSRRSPPPPPNIISIWSNNAHGKLVWITTSFKHCSFPVRQMYMIKQIEWCNIIYLPCKQRGCLVSTTQNRSVPSTKHRSNNDERIVQGSVASVSSI